VIAILDDSRVGLRDWFDVMPRGRVLAAAFDTRINARSAFTGRASRSIRRLLKRHGYRVIASDVKHPRARLSGPGYLAVRERDQA
jgi:hypothetical protein